MGPALLILRLAENIPANLRRHPALAALACCVLLEARAESPPALPPAAGAAHRPPARMTRALLEKLPQYTAPAQAAAAFPSREADGFADEILRLPKLTVRPSPVAPESDYALLNPQGRLELALKTNPGIRLGNIFGLNEITARTMQREERLAAKKADLAEQVRRSTLGDSELDRKIRGLTETLAQRSGTERDFPSVYLPPREKRGRPQR